MKLISARKNLITIQYKSVQNCKGQGLLMHIVFQVQTYISVNVFSEQHYITFQTPRIAKSWHRVLHVLFH